MTPTKEQLDRRFAKAFADEQTQSEAWWWLSFADEERFLGAAVVRGRGILTATREALRLGCNPGGEIQAISLLDDEVEEHLPAGMRERLLSLAEMEAAGWEPQEWPEGFGP